MAEGFFNRGAYRRKLDMRACSAGLNPAIHLDSTVCQVMDEAKSSLDYHIPKSLSQPMMKSAQVIVTIGCRVDAARSPHISARVEEWCIDDPSGQPIEKVREIRDQTKARVEKLLVELE